MIKWILAATVVLFIAWSTWRKPRLTGTILWSLTATVLGTSGLLLMLPTAFKPTILWTSLATPLIWAAFMFWCYWDARAWRPTAGLILVTLLGTAAVIVLPPPGA
ncbi:MAG: hypothetical protein AAF545_01200 [Pseudomonadota bacterium]